MVRYTGSGKTHTVLGSGGEEGLYYKVCMLISKGHLAFTIAVNIMIVNFMIFIMITVFSNSGSRRAAEQTKDHAAR